MQQSFQSTVPGQSTTISLQRKIPLVPLLITFLVIIGVTFLGFYLSGYFNNQDPKNFIKIDDNQQASIPKLIVNEVTLSKPGFIIVRKLNDGKIGSVIGNSKYINAGTSKDITIQIYLSGSLIPGDTALVHLVYDDGNHTFGKEDVDKLVTDKSGKVVGQEITLK